MRFPGEINTERFRFVNYTKLSEINCDRYLICTTNPSVACWMENTDSIFWNDHLAFIQSLCSRRDEVYYAVFVNAIWDI